MNMKAITPMITDDGLEKPPDEEAGHGPMLGTLRRSVDP